MQAMHDELRETRIVLSEGQQATQAEIRAMSADIRALIARLDAIIRGRDNGGATP
jgi:hypothetical protein